MYAPAGWYEILMIVSAIVALMAAVVAWRSRAAGGAALFALCELMVAIWAIAAALEASALHLELKLRWNTLAQVGACLAPVFYLGFALGVSRKTRWLTSANVVLACLVPIISIALAVTNSQHHLLWSEITLVAPGLPANYVPGPWFPYSMVYTYGTVVVGAIIFWQYVLRSRAYATWQYILFAVATVAPSAVSIFYLLPSGPTAGMNLTPAGFMVSGLALLAGIRYLSLFELVPVARHKVLDIMADAVLVLDAQHRVVDINPAMAALLPTKNTIGKPAEQLFSATPDLLSSLSGTAEVRLGLTWPSGDRSRILDVRATPLHDSQQCLSGWLLVLRDVSERKALQTEREQLIGELEEAVGHVKTLSGLLPICASCKRIRDEQHAWHRVEEYVTDHSEASFTHSICPDCMQQYMAELDESAPPASLASDT